MDWKAKWIWDNGEAAPRNYWLCFRKSFGMQAHADETLLHITADSRYTAYVNGFYIGMGPVRGWPSEQFYDTYDVSEFLKIGENVITVLVTHYGVSNFQYIEGRGGLFAQLEILEETNRKIIGTDSSWKAHIHNGYVKNSVRICCQQAWTEIFDANALDEDWKNIGFDDTTWEPANEVGNYGIEPWIKLQKRDIPLLREEPVFPHRVEAVREVIPTGFSVSLDLQPNFFPGEADANPKDFLGYIASIIYAPEDMKGIIKFPWDNWLSTYGNFKINESIYVIYKGEREIHINLRKGDNFFLMDLSGRTHLPFVFFNIETQEPIKFTVPGYQNTEFVTIGTFEHKSIINVEIQAGNEIDVNNAVYKDVWKVTDWIHMGKFDDWIKPVAKGHACQNNVYMASVYKNVLKSVDVSYEFQNMIIPNQEYSLINPCRFGDTEVIVDFSREVSGFIEFEVDAPKGTIIDFYGVEYIKPNIDIEHTEGVNCTLRYIAKDGRQHYRSFIRRGFRYLVLTFRKASRPVKCYKVFINQSTYPVVNAGMFESSDWKLNRIWEISKYTTQLCMEDTYVDCPAYEQAFWVGDARNESLVNYYAFGAYGLCKRSLKLVAGSMNRSPLPESQVPSGWQNILPAWVFFWINACREYYEYTADMEFLKEIYPELMKALNGFLDRLTEESLLFSDSWNLLEWAPMDIPEKGIMTHQNAELVKSLRDAAKIAEWLDRGDEANKLISIAKNIKKAINEYLWDEEEQAFVDCIHENGERSKIISMQTNVIAYLYECVEGNRKTRIERYLLAPPIKFVQIKNPFMLFFYFEALAKFNKTEVIARKILQEWGKMLDKGATTCWETIERFDMDRPTRSHCHAWSAAPGYFLGAFVLGIRPLAPGFRKVLVDPKPCGLQWAKGSVPVPGGRIDIMWKVKNGKTKVHVNGPMWIEYVYGDTIQ